MRTSSRSSESERPRVLVVEHHRDGDPGRLLPALDHAGFELNTIRTHVGGLPPRSLDGYAGYVSMGGDMYVSDADRHEFIQIEQALFREAIDRELPAIGICLGAQILASSLGARVSRDWPAQIGWDCVQFVPDGDPVAVALAPEALLFEWHHESFELPASAVLLGGSATVPVQAFRAGSAWGFQFHLEAEARHVQAWSKGSAGAEELEAFGCEPPDKVESFYERLHAQMALADEVFFEFAHLIG